MANQKVKAEEYENLSFSILYRKIKTKKRSMRDVAVYCAFYAKRCSLFISLCDKVFYQALYVFQTDAAYSACAGSCLYFFQSICAAVNGVFDHTACDGHAVTNDFVKIHKSVFRPFLPSLRKMGLIPARAVFAWSRGFRQRLYRF